MRKSHCILRYIDIIFSHFGKMHNQNLCNVQAMPYFAATSPKGDVAFWLAKIYISNVRQGAETLLRRSADNTSQQRLPKGTLRFSSLKFIYATSGKGRDVAEKKSC